MTNNWIAYDTETTGLNRHATDVGMFSYSLGTPDGRTSVHRLNDDKNRLKLTDLWRDTATVKVAHNIKFDAGMTQKFLANSADVTASPWRDTATEAAILLNKHYSFRLKDLCWDLAGIPKDDEKAVKRHMLPGENFSHVPQHLMEKYQHTDALRVVVLDRFLYPKLQANPKLMACFENEMELLKITYRMEERGLYLRRAAAVALRSRLLAEGDALLQKASGILGRKGDLRQLNLANPNVARELLYGEMDLPILKRTGKSGLPSADKSVLMELYEQHPENEILGLILHYRSWKRGAAMMTSYLEHADLRGDDAIHPTINTNGAKRTGRQSCSDPNLQNVEKGANEAGKKNPYPVPAREVFGPRPGYVNFHIDYRGIELRLLVEYSGDKLLIDAIRDEDLGKGGGPHNLAASYFYPAMTMEEARRWGVTDPDMIAGFQALFAKGNGGDAYSKIAAKRLRDTGKNAHFAGPYGAGDSKIAATLNLPDQLGTMRFATYKALVPKIFGLTADVIQYVKSHGYTENRFGRQFFVPQDEAYIGTNYLIQGTASEILKRGTVRSDRVLAKISGTPMRLLLPIHDELVIECPYDYLPDAPATLRAVREVMIDFPEFTVPMEIDVEISTQDWAHKIDFDIYGEVRKWDTTSGTILTLPTGKKRRLMRA